MLQLVGAVTLASLTDRLASWCAFWLLPPIPLTRYQSTPDSWGLITGASAGIGLGFAEELAARAFNVILLGHNQDELRQVRTVLIEKYSTVKVELILIDVTSASTADIEGVLLSISQKVTVLVNNVGGLGVSPSLHYRRVDVTSAEEMDRVFSLNVIFMAHVTRHLIPLLARNGPSLVLNVGSASMLGMPGVATYSGCKAFVASFTKAIAREMDADGDPVDVLGIILGEVHTQANTGKLPLESPNGREVAAAALNLAGRAVTRGKRLFHPWMLHAIEDTIVAILPAWLMEKVLRTVFSNKRSQQNDYQLQ